MQGKKKKKKKQHSSIFGGDDRIGPVTGQDSKWLACQDRWTTEGGRDKDQLRHILKRRLTLGGVGHKMLFNAAVYITAHTQIAPKEWVTVVFECLPSVPTSTSSLWSKNRFQSCHLANHHSRAWFFFNTSANTKCWRQLSEHKQLCKNFSSCRDHV